MAARDPVLLPPPVRTARPLPVWLAFVALAGLAVLACSTVPAVLTRSRLASDLERLRVQVSRQEAEVRRLETLLGAAETDSFTHERALRCLLHPLAEHTAPRGER